MFRHCLLFTKGTEAGGYGSSLVTSAPFDRKLLLATHTQPKLHASDLELAQAILVQ
jgi:hypothetical protein